MNCRVCNASNPDSNRFCGQCGSILDLGAEQLQKQIVAVVRQKVKNGDVLAAEITNKIQDQLWRWGIVLGLASTLFVASLAFFGVTSYESAKSQIENAASKGADTLTNAATAGADNLNKTASQKQTDLGNQETEILSRLQNTAQPVEAKIQGVGTREKILSVQLEQEEAANNDYKGRFENLEALRESSPNTPIGTINNQIFQPINTSISAPIDILRPAYAIGSTGQGVSSIQTRLTELGCYSGPISGTFDSATADAVKAFESAKYQSGSKIPRIVPPTFTPNATDAPALGSGSIGGPFSSGEVGISEWSDLFSSSALACN
jgi:hypothetical protein